MHNNVPLQCITLHVRIVKEKYYLTVCAFDGTNALTSFAHAWWLLKKNITIPQLGLVLHVEMTFPLFSQLLTLNYKIYILVFWSNIIYQQFLNPFELNDIDCTQPNYEIDPDSHYFNDVSISNMLKCSYYVS